MRHDLPFLDSMLGIFVFLSISGTLLYLTLAACTYQYFFVYKRATYIPDYVPDRAENKKAVLWGVISIVGNSALTAPVHFLIAQGKTAVYFDVAERGVPYLLVSALVYLFITETLIYWTHRALHHRLLYKWLHLKHHEFRKPTPWAGVAFNPLDSFLQALPHHLCALFLPIHIGLYLGMLTFVTVWAVMIHDRVSLVRWDFVNFTGHHTMHHHYNKYNFGQFFTFWDRWGGTYKSPSDAPEKFLLPYREPTIREPSPAE